ncbi:MAG: hypothetical protein ABMA13_12385 [Chthoniobacteraceae bacterium]
MKNQTQADGKNNRTASPRHRNPAPPARHRKPRLAVKSAPLADLKKAHRTPPSPIAAQVEPSIRYESVGMCFELRTADGTQHRKPKPLGETLSMSIASVDAVRIMSRALRENAGLFEGIVRRSHSKGESAVAMKVAAAIGGLELQGADFASVRELHLEGFGPFAAASWRTIADCLSTRFTHHIEELELRDRSGESRVLLEQALCCALLISEHDYIRLDVLNQQLTPAESETIDAWELAVERELEKLDESELASAAGPGR